MLVDDWQNKGMPKLIDRASHFHLPPSDLISLRDAEDTTDKSDRTDILVIETTKRNTWESRSDKSKDSLCRIPEPLGSTGRRVRGLLRFRSVLW